MDDLLRVPAEVGDRVEGGSEDVGVEALNPPRPTELLVVESGENGVGLTDGFSKLRQQLASGNFGIVGELAGTVADVGRAADAADDPLSHVTREVQHQVGD